MIVNLLPENLRTDFPLLQKEQPLIYFDNACATLKPEAVLRAMDEYNREYPTCGGRSVNRLGEWVTKTVHESRTKVADFIGARMTEEILFVRNTTEGINLLAYTLPLEAGDVILTTDKEHNSNLVPWQRASARAGAIHKVVRSNPDGTFNLDTYEQALKEGNVKVVAFGMVSNLDGVAIPAREVVALAHYYNATVVLDAAQAAPHQVMNVTELDVDYLVFSGHKLCGPSGTGVVYGKLGLLEHLPPFITGGSTVGASTYDSHTLLSSPEKFEGGTQDYAGIIGLGAAVTYLEAIGLDHIQAHEATLNHYATEQIKQLPMVTVLGPEAATKRSGILSFTIDNIDIHQIAITLDRSANVAVRSGQHCVHSWFADRGLTGSVRFSFYLYNTKAEIDAAIAALTKIIAVYR